MSAATHTPSSSTSPSTAHSYAVDMMSSLAPHINELGNCLAEGIRSIDRFSVNDQLLRIQVSLAEAKRQIERQIPAEMLRLGAEYGFLVSSAQQELGAWIKGTYELISEGFGQIRSTMYHPQTDTLELRDVIVGDEQDESRLLPRLMRHLAQSHEFTGLNLAAPAERARFGITVDFSLLALRGYIPSA